MNIVILDRMALGEDIDMSVFEKLGTVTIYERTCLLYTSDAADD